MRKSFEVTMISHWRSDDDNDKPRSYDYLNSNGYYLSNETGNTFLTWMKTFVLQWHWVYRQCAFLHQSYELELEHVTKSLYHGNIPNLPFSSFSLRQFGQQRVLSTWRWNWLQNLRFWGRQSSLDKEGQQNETQHSSHVFQRVALTKGDLSLPQAARFVMVALTKGGLSLPQAARLVMVVQSMFAHS